MPGKVIIMHLEGDPLEVQSFTPTANGMAKTGTAHLRHFHVLNYHLKPGEKLMIESSKVELPPADPMPPTFPQSGSSVTGGAYSVPPAHRNTLEKFIDLFLPK